MISKYGLVCEVADIGSFSAVAEKYGFVQSSVSQSVKSLEDELGVCLIDRKRNGASWSVDGRKFEPFIRAVYTAEKALELKRKEMLGLENEVIRVGVFTSVSRDILPSLMTGFRENFPQVRFVLLQGNYSDIVSWLQTDKVDVGFLSSEYVGDLSADELFVDKTKLIMPKNSVLSNKEDITYKDLEKMPFILMDEGKISTIRDMFAKQNAYPKIEYRIYDDYTIISMVKNGLGASLLFENMVRGFDDEVDIREISDPLCRRVCLACKDRKTLSHAALMFRNYVVENIDKVR